MVNQKDANAAGGSKKKKGQTATGSAAKQSAPPQQQQNQQKKVISPPPSQLQQANKPQVNQQNGPIQPKITEKPVTQPVPKETVDPPASLTSSQPMTQPGASSTTTTATSSTKPNEEGKSKKELQAERRAKQEADRARKEQAKSGKAGGGAASGTSSAKPTDSMAVKPKDLTSSSDPSRKSAATAANASVPVREMGRMSLLDSPGQANAIHPAFITLKARCDSRELVDLDAICIEFIVAFKQFVSTYNKPSDKAMSRDLEALIKPQLSYITGGLPLPLAIGNLVKQLKQEINALPDDYTEEKGKELLTDWLNDFVEHRIVLAYEAISLFTYDKLKGAHVVLTYSWCPLVQQTLLTAHQKGVKFHVCVLDSHHDQRGKKLLSSLCKAEISCSYGLITSISHLIKQCRLVLLGCSAILSNGYALGTRGSSQVAMVAQAANIPVLFATPTYKFVDKVQTFTEWDRSTALVSERMEMIPAELITAVVTELRILPPSSAPAVLRAKQLVNV